MQNLLTNLAEILLPKLADWGNKANTLGSYRNAPIGAMTEFAMAINQYPGGGKDPAASDHLLTEKEVAARLHWSVKTLQRRRWLGQEPAFVKVGASVRYEPAVIDAFIEAGQRNPVPAP